MSRRNRTVLIGLLLAVVVGVLGSTVRVPLVALGPGPTIDTLGQVGDRPVVAVRGVDPEKTSGRLNLTTVSVSDRLTMFHALELWISGDARLVPRELVYPPDKTDEQVDQDVRRMFTSSEVNAKVAAMTYLNRPVKVLVGAVGERSPAAGVLAPGDQLVAVASRPIERASAVYDALKQTRPGQQVSITYRRGSSAPQTGVVTLGARPDDAPQGFLDVMPAAEPLNPDEVVIGLADIGGPSAGLIFALAVIDKLTPGELTGGRFVAGTGEISQSGEVGRISGIPFKMIAAKRAGATVFLVPEGNCEEAASTAPDGLQLIKAGNLGQAVAGLDALREGRPVAGC